MFNCMLINYDVDCDDDNDDDYGSRHTNYDVDCDDDNDDTDYGPRHDTEREFNRRLPC